MEPRVHDGQVRLDAARTGNGPRVMHPACLTQRYYGLKPKEHLSSTVARSRVFALLSHDGVVAREFVPGDLTPGSFLFLGLFRRGAPLGLCVWGMGIRACGFVSCDRWQVFEIPQSARTAVLKGEVRRMLSRRLLRFPADIHGMHAGDAEGMRGLKTARVLYE